MNDFNLNFETFHNFDPLRKERIHTDGPSIASEESVCVCDWDFK